MNYDDLGDERPSSRADVGIERTRICLKAGGKHVRGELEVSSRGTGRSPFSAAMTFFLVAVAAGVSTVVVNVVLGIAHAAAGIVVSADLAVFAGC